MSKPIAFIVLLALCAPGFGQNLLLNGSFDVVAGSENPDFPNDPVNARIWLGDYNMYGLPNLECLYPACEEGVDPDKWCYQECGEIPGCVEPDEDPTCCDAREAGCLNPCCCTDPCELAYGGWGSRNHLIGPLGVIPEWQAWEKATGGADSEPTQTFQTVAVSAEAMVTFDGYVHTGPTGNDEVNNITITLFDGEGVGGTVIDTVSIDETLASGGTWFQVSTHPEAPIGGVCATGYVTVEFTTDTGAPHGYAGVVHAENFSLTSSVACATQHTLDPISPAIQKAHNADVTDEVISGTNMDLVTGVKLIQIESQTVIKCTITGSTTTSVTVDMPIATAGAALGLYTLLTEQEDCVGQTEVDAYEVVCANPTSFATISPTELQAPQGTVEFTVSGQNLDELDSVSLVIGGADPIPGQSLHMVGNDLKADFNLGAKPIGVYSLKGMRPDACSDPSDLLAAFRLLGSVDCEELLFNGDFESEGPQPPNTPMTASSGWEKGPPHPDPWISLRYNEDIPDNDTPLPPGPVAGDNSATIHTGDGDLGRAYQTVSDVIPGSELTLTGFMFGCSADSTNPDRKFAHRVILWDGAMDSSQLASWVMDNADHCIDWVPFSITGMPTTGSAVTVEFGWQRGGDSGWAIPNTSMDEMNLCMPKPCNDPFADFDEDGDVDQDDFAVLQKCMTATQMLPGCDCADSNHDAAVNDTDYNAFEACASGPEVLADPYCDDPQACCLPDNSCEDLLPHVCVSDSYNGTPAGPDTDSLSTTCPLP